MKPTVALLTAVIAAFAATASALADEAALTEAELGARLFFDTSFSINRTTACASCHDPARAFTDGRETPARGAVSVGDDGHALGVRNAPMVTYAAATPPFHYDAELKAWLGGQFLDGRAATLADQAVGPPLNPIEMMMPDAASVVARLRENDDYVVAFRQLYGPDIFTRAAEAGAPPPAYAAFGRAIEAYERTDTFATYDSKYDRYLEGEYDLTPLEDLGRTLFFSNNNVNCSSCHRLDREDAPREPEPGRVGLHGTLGGGGIDPDAGTGLGRHRDHQLAAVAGLGDGGAELVDPDAEVVDGLDVEAHHGGEGSHGEAHRAEVAGVGGDGDAHRGAVGSGHGSILPRPARRRHGGVAITTGRSGLRP